MIARRHFFLRFLGLFAAVAVPGAARADRKKPRGATGAPGPSTKKTETARLRLWKATDAPGDVLGIRLLLTGKPDSAALSPLKADSANYQFSDYVDVPAGLLTTEITAPGRPTVLLPMPLPAGGQSTLLVRLQNANLSAEWINDTPTPADGGCEFRVYNLLPAIGDIQINLGALLSAHLTTARSGLRLSGIKPAPYTVAVAGSIGAGKNFQTKADVDFTQSRRVTLLLNADSYGRIRLKLDTAGST